ncbi:hypothetical protein AK830_g4995 [Neonectria ditissima]|uniref:Heterokaryon incompatibility domain-containing protein n=1 Tax=Neonectria ditissima TaxID=78410 RepID=A0A0P7AUI3_9HYPO|nr:hypothetical protein AK830_g4995 [Neonectria ditissima]
MPDESRSRDPRDRAPRDRDPRDRDLRDRDRDRDKSRGDRDDWDARDDSPDSPDRRNRARGNRDDSLDSLDRDDSPDSPDRRNRDRDKDRADKGRVNKDRTDKDRLDRDRDRDRADRDRVDRDRGDRDDRAGRVDRDKDRDREPRDRDTHRSPEKRDRPSHLRDREHLKDQPASKRNSITDRLFGSFSAARNKDAPPPVTRSSLNPVQRRSSSATKQSPVPRLREWLDACNIEHEHHCAVSSDTEVHTWHPIRLIDVVERRLVRATNKDRYLALSYVWGSPIRRNGAPAQFQTLKSNVDAFQDKIPDNDIPQTFVDAMWLAKKLGIRHLWIDKLCIVQDDAEEMDSNVTHMAYVFANSYLTLVAAAGDAHTGLTSLNPRKPTRGIRTGGRDQQELILSSTWNTRGWTLVERLYSRRCVFFFEDLVTWECHCEKWSGSPSSVMKKIRGNRHDCANPVPDAAFAFHHTAWPDLDEYARIVMDYSARRLTLVDDTLRAFAGITHVLSRSYPGGFIYGMPVMFLDIALLWRPHASVRRRALSRAPFLPSWSWMGWWFDNIPVDLTLWRAAADYVEDPVKPGKRGQESKRFRSPHSFRIRPTVTWSLTDRSATVPVENTGLQFRDLRGRRSASSDLPPGWSRSGSLYKHDSDDATLFRYPVPVEDPPDLGGYDPPAGELALPGPLLSFRTTTGFFEVDYMSTLAHRDRPNPPIAVGNIWGKANRWVGQFRAHDAWLGVQSSNYDGDEKLEFIAISSATERRGSHALDAEHFDEVMDANEEVELVNVLWIERIGEVAFRRGVGHILQKAWETQAKDEVGILLG